MGTSSGSRVALHLASGVAHEEVFERRLRTSPPSAEPPPAVDWVELRDSLAHAKQAGGGKTQILRRYGSLALAAALGRNDSARREIVAAQLPMETWPEKKALIVAVNADSGERRAFDRNSGIDLVDAVIASTASFGWPPTLFRGQHYMDGGFYSTDNADLATGFDRVMIPALQPGPLGVASMSLVKIDAAVNALRSGGAQVEVIHPDEDTLATLASAGGVMNPAISAPAARTGRLQGGRTVSERISSFWK